MFTLTKVGDAVSVMFVAGSKPLTINMVWVILTKTFTETFKKMLRSFIFEGMVTEVTTD